MKMDNEDGYLNGNSEFVPFDIDWEEYRESKNLIKLLPYDIKRTIFSELSPPHCLDFALCSKDFYNVAISCLPRKFQLDSLPNYLKYKIFSELSPENRKALGSCTKSFSKLIADMPRPVKIKNQMLNDRDMAGLQRINWSSLILKGCIITHPNKWLPQLLKLGKHTPLWLDTVNEKTILQWGAYYGNVDIVLQSLEQGCKVNKKDAEGNTSLHLNANTNKIVITDILLDRTAHVNELNQAEQTPLHIAAQNGNKNTVMTLVARGANMKLKDKNGNTPALLAAQNGKIGVCLALIPHITDVNEKDSFGRTLLHWSAHYGNIHLTKKLLELGARLNIKDNNNETALNIAAQNGHIDLIELFIIRQEVDIKHKDQYGYNPFHWMLKHGFQKGVIIFLNEGMPVNEFGKNNPLYIASSNGHIEIVKLLLSKGAIIDRTHLGLTALHYAAVKGHHEIMKLLILHKAPVDKKTYSSGDDNSNRAGHTPLHYSVKGGHLEATRLLLSSGANVNILDERGRSPLYFAVKNRDIQIAKILVKTGVDDYVLSLSLDFARSIKDIAMVNLLQPYKKEVCSIM